MKDKSIPKTAWPKVMGDDNVMLTLRNPRCYNQRQKPIKLEELGFVLRICYQIDHNFVSVSLIAHHRLPEPGLILERKLMENYIPAGLWMDDELVRTITQNYFGNQGQKFPFYEIKKLSCKFMNHKKQLKRKSCLAIVSQ